MSAPVLLPSILVVLFAAGSLFRAEAAAGTAAPTNSAAVRIVSFLPSATETLFALGLGPRVVGRSRFCDAPAEALALPAVGDLFTANEGAVAALRPTHALLGRADAPQGPLLRALGVEVVEARAETASDVLALADRLGALFPDGTNGLALPGTPWRTAMEALAAAPPAAPGAPAALVVVSHAPGRWGEAFAAGEGTFYDELLRASGFSNALAGVRGYPTLAPDRLAALAPAVLFDVHPSGAAEEPDAWAYLPATRAVAIRDTAALRPGPRLPEVRAAFAAAAP